jgi:TonB-dependent SusC/RagA subfamily outer membrane receptor
MTNVRPAHPILVSSPFIAIACTAAAIAAQTPLPAAPPAPAAPASAAAPATPPAWRSDLSFDSRVTPAMPATPAAPPSRTVPPTVSPVPASPVSRPAVATPAESPVAPTALAEPPAAPPRHSAPSAPREIPIEVIRGWIARYHPSILVGDTSIAVVTVVVGANDEYISSVTDKLPDNVQGDVAILDPMAGLRVEGIENIELLKGAAAAAEYGPDALNGVVVVTTKSGLADPARAMRDTGAAKSVARLVRLRLPEEQTAKIGHDPIYIVDGVLVNPQPAQTPSSNAGASLERIGVPSDGIGSVEILKLAPGRIGPNALRVVLVKLRGRG